MLCQKLKEYGPDKPVDAQVPAHAFNLPPTLCMKAPTAIQQPKHVHLANPQQLSYSPVSTCRAPGIFITRPQAAQPTLTRCPADAAALACRTR